MRQYLAVLLAVILLALPWMDMEFPAETRMVLEGIKGAYQSAAVFLSHQPKTAAEIKSRYVASTSQSDRKVRVLIVPGHEPGNGGAEYADLKERKLTPELARYLERFLKGNNHFQVFTSRSADSWDPIFSNYFAGEWDDIASWQRLHKEEIVNLTRLGKYQEVKPPVFHNSVPDDVALRLYGIDKWANENDIDIILHLHFNDYPRKRGGRPGEYSGFSIYVPEKQYYNSSTTHALADGIFSRLKKYNPVSDFPGESGGIVEDQDLIAIGAYNSVNGASMLIEYGYLYEPQFADLSLREQTLEDLAFQTYLGLLDFFDSEAAKVNPFDTLVLPHQWKTGALSETSSSDIFALQTALQSEGIYPPRNKSKNDCPRTGLSGPCTKEALKAFQDKNAIEGEFGFLGEKTVRLLNLKYSAGNRP